MNSLYTLCAFAIGAVCAVKLLKQFRTDLGTLLSAAAGIVITASLVSLLVPVIELLESFSRSAGLENYFPILLKSLGIALICTLTADICRDCGEPGIASKVELGGKIGILLYTLPIVRALADLATGLI